MKYLYVLLFTVSVAIMVALGAPSLPVVATLGVTMDTNNLLVGKSTNVFYANSNLLNGSVSTAPTNTVTTNFVQRLTDSNAIAVARANAVGTGSTNALQGATNVVLHTNTLRAGKALVLTNGGIARIDLAVMPGFFTAHFQNRIPRFVINSGTGATFTGVGDSATIAAFAGAQVAVAGDATGPPGVIMPTAATTTTMATVSGNLNFRTGKNCESAVWAGVTNTATAFTFWHQLTDQAASVVTGTNPNGNYAGFRYNSTGDTTFKFITKDNSTQTITDTLVALGNSFHTFWFFEDVPNSRWIGYIDGLPVATNSTHLPSATTYLRYVVSATTDANSTNALRMSWEAAASDNF